MTDYDEIIEQATKVMHSDVCCPCDPQGCDWTHTREARYAWALSDAGLLARTLPDRDQIAKALFVQSDRPNASVMAKVWDAPGDGGKQRWWDYADAVLALLKGQEA